MTCLSRSLKPRCWQPRWQPRASNWHCLVRTNRLLARKSTVRHPYRSSLLCHVPFSESHVHPCLIDASSVGAPGYGPAELVDDVPPLVDPPSAISVEELAEHLIVSEGEDAEEDAEDDLAGMMGQALPPGADDDDEDAEGSEEEGGAEEESGAENEEEESGAENKEEEGGAARPNKRVTFT